MRENLTNRVAPRRWRTLNLENEYLKCVVLPDLGGHVYRCIDKRNGADMFYANPSLKFARIAYRGVWAAYGIEFNFPVSHNWMTASPVDFSTSTAADGSASVWVRNIDRVYGMEWCVQLTLHPGEALLEQKTTLYNPGAERHRFYWWTNAGVQVWDDSRLYYPQDYSVTHGFVDLDTWPVDRTGTDLSVVANHKFGPVSRFSYASNEPYMGVYGPKTTRAWFTTRLGPICLRKKCFRGAAMPKAWAGARRSLITTAPTLKFRRVCFAIRKRTAFLTRSKPSTLRKSGCRSWALGASRGRIQMRS